MLMPLMPCYAYHVTNVARMVRAWGQRLPAIARMHAQGPNGTLRIQAGED